MLLRAQEFFYAEVFEDSKIVLNNPKLWPPKKNLCLGMKSLLLPPKVCDWEFPTVHTIRYYLTLSVRGICPATYPKKKKFGTLAVRWISLTMPVKKKK